MPISTRIRTLLAVLAVSLAVPAIALADGPNDTVALEKKGEGAKGKRRERRGDRAEKANFPMSGEAFLTRIDKRLEKGKERLEKHLEKSKATDEKKAEIRSSFKAAAGKIKAAANKAAADDKVTKDEAKTVRQVAKEAKKDLHAKHGKKGKGKKGKGRKGKGRKGKGQKGQRA